MPKKKQPEYKKALKEASAALTKVKIEHGHRIGSGDRATERLQCLLAQHKRSVVASRIAR